MYLSDSSITASRYGMSALSLNCGNLSVPTTADTSSYTFDIMSVWFININRIAKMAFVDVRRPEAGAIGNKSTTYNTNSLIMIIGRNVLYINRQ